MKRTLLASSALALCLAASAAVGVQTYPLPAGIVSVSPSQGLVNTAGSATPLGVTVIDLTFSSRADWEPNRSCAEPVLMYIDGEEEPADAAYASIPEQVYFDQLGFAIGGIKFPHKHLDPGLYHIVIPEGLFINAGELSPAMELGYEIYYPYEVTPAPGAYDSIGEWIMTFPDYNEVKVLKEGSFYIQNWPDAQVYTLKCEVIQREGVDPNSLKITLSRSGRNDLIATDPGDYRFFFPSGAFQLTTYGGTYYEDPTDKKTETTPEIQLSYWVRWMPEPACDPAPGVVESFRSFKLSFDSDYNILFVDDRTTGAGIFRELPDGQLSQDKVYDVIVGSHTDKTVTYNLAYWVEGTDDEAGYFRAYRSAQNPGPGNYVLYVPSKVITFSYKGKVDVYGEDGLPVLDDNGNVVQVESDIIVNGDPVYIRFNIPLNVFEAETDPADGSTVDILSDVVMTFPKATNMALNEAAGDAVVKDADGNPVEGVQVLVAVPGSISPLAEGDAAGDDTSIKAYVTFFPEIVKKGTYTVTIPAGKLMSGSDLSPEYTLTYSVTGNLSSVDELETVTSDAPVYNVLGQRVDASYKGIVIRNGKKFIRR